MNITVDHADLVIMGDNRVWMLALIVDRNGVTDRVLHILPEETLENLAAELDMTANQFDQLLEVALYSPFAEPITADDPKATLNAGTFTEARDHILTRVAAVKGDGVLTGQAGQSETGAAGPTIPVLTSSGLDDPLEVLRDAIPLDRKAVDAKRAAVRQRRAQTRHQRTERRRRRAALTDAPSVDERIDRLRALNSAAD